MTTAFGTAGKVITSCWKIYSAWKEKATQAEQAELEKIIDDLQAGKTLGRRAGESLARSLQSLKLSPSTLEKLRQLEADTVFHTSAADHLLHGSLSTKKLARLLQECSSGVTCPAQEIESVAALWLDAIDLTIGDNNSLSHALQLKSGRRIESAALTLNDKSDEIIAVTREILQARETGNKIGLENMALSRDIVENIRRIEERLSASSQPTKAQSVLERHLQSRFEKCREHLRFGSIDVAEKEFADLISDIVEAGELGSAELLFRSHLNHSSCLILQERTVDAKQAIDRARQIFPKDKRLLRHEATLLSYEGKSQQALEIVRELRMLEPDEVKNIADEIALLHDLKRNEELTRLVDTVDFEDADVQCHKAHALLQLGRHAEAVKAAKKATQIKPESEGPWIALAYSLGFPAVHRWEEDKRSQLCIVGDDEAQMSEAIEAALKAEAILNKRSRKALLEEVQANLLAFYILSCRNDDGLQLAMRMEASKSTSEVALGNLYHIFFMSGKSDKALEVADVMVAKLQTAESRMRKAKAFILAGNGALALQELAALKSVNEHIIDNPVWIATASSAHYAQHQADEALEMLQRGIILHPESVELHLETAKLMAEMQRDDQALKYFKIAESLSPTHLEVLSDFGQFLYFNRDWLGALERFEKIGARSPLNPLFPNLVASLCNAGRFDDCLDCVRIFITSRQCVEKTVFGAGSRAAIVLDEWPLAKELLERLVRSGGSRHFENLKLLANVYLRLDDNQEAYTLLSQAVPEDSNDIEALTLLAQVSAACGKHSEALMRHARSIKTAPTSIQARAAFFDTMLKLPEGFEPTEEIIRLHHENIQILASDPSGVLRSIQVKREDGEFDFSKVHQELEKRAKIVTKVLDHSAQNPMPLQFLTEDLGIKMFEGWSAFTTDPKRGIRMCSGTRNEQDAQLRAISLCKAVSVDLVALFSLQGLGKLGLLNKLFDKVFIHISILDAVVAELREAVAWPNSDRISSVNGQMILFPSDKNESERRVQALTEIRNFLKSDRIVLSGLRLTSKFSSFVSDSACNSRIENLMKPALVALDQNAAFLSDDLIQRALSARLRCPSFCTQALLRRALSETIISLSEYQDAVLTLHSWNYHFVSDNRWTLLRLLEREKAPASALAQKVLSNLVCNSLASNESRSLLIELILYTWAKSHQQDLSARQWIRFIWNLVEQADPKMKLAFQLISDFPMHPTAEPRLFSLFISFVYEALSGDRKKGLKLLNHGLMVANRIAARSFEHGDKDLKRAWKSQATELEILKMIKVNSSTRR